MRILCLDAVGETNARRSRTATRIDILRNAGFDAHRLLPTRTSVGVAADDRQRVVAAITAELRSGDVVVVPGTDAAAWATVAGEFSLILDEPAPASESPLPPLPRCIGILTEKKSACAQTPADSLSPPIFYVPMILPPSAFSEQHRQSGSTPRILVVGSPKFDGHAEMARYELHMRGMPCNYVANAEDNDNIVGRLRTHDVLIHLDSSDRLPFFWAAAMAQGMIVISYGGGTEGEFIVDGVNGWKFDDGDWRRAARRAAEIRDMERSQTTLMRTAAQLSARSNWGEPARRALIDAMTTMTAPILMRHAPPKRRSRRGDAERTTTNETAGGLRSA